MDTTVLVDALLKNGATKAIARDALSRSVSRLPVYAIKEFRLGPLNNHIWLHNKLASSASLSEAFEALHSMSMTPRRYTTATAIEALRDGLSKLPSLDKFAAEYGSATSTDAALCDSLRLSTKAKILGAWQKRRSMTSSVGFELSCFNESDPVELPSGLLKFQPAGCQKDRDCAVQDALRGRASELKTLELATANAEKRETQRRHQVLRKLRRKPNQQLSANECRALGDAVFALAAHEGETVLTTNTRDHEPLCTALGKTCSRPEEIL